MESTSLGAHVMHVAVVGAGWAGCAAAVQATQLGHKVTLLEAARTVGGRARNVPLANGLLWDNGQHILIGAYRHCLALMQTLGVHTAETFTRLPLDLRTPNGHGIQLPPSSAFPSWDMAKAIALAKGWNWHDRASLLLAATHWRIQGFTCPPTSTVTQVCKGISPNVMQSFIAPLCISAFNSAPEHTSGRIFLRVLHDALLGERGSTDVLIARQPLASTLAEPAVQWLQQHGAQVLLGERVQTIEAQTDGSYLINAKLQCDAVLLACPAWEAARLAQPFHADWAQQAAALLHAPIATVYAWCPHAQVAHLPPMQALVDSPDAPAQFAFSHPHIRHGESSLLACVVSHVPAHLQRPALQDAVVAQVRQQLQLQQVQPITTLVEKRATFVCHASVQRPTMQIAANLYACGDYVEGPYPATLEGAVLSGTLAAKQLGKA